ncbi:MAG TPA: hypothetical protein VFG50_14780 [Rhodothermales bacterium]|nr:hypothetical protein [Rhodothermales bacterium]
MPARVQILRFSLVALVLTILTLSACTEGETKDPDVEPHAASGQFGDSYQLVNNFVPADPEVVPQFHQDTLVAKVVYTGGCEDHDFDLKSEVARDTAKLWFTHNAHGDDCEAQVQDEIRQTVSPDVLNAPVIVLLDPNDGPPHIVKWGK